MGTRGLYELKRYFQQDCHFKDQRLTIQGEDLPRKRSWSSLKGVVWVQAGNRT